jgi:hypothetical protein
MIAVGLPPESVHKQLVNVTVVLPAVMAVPPTVFVLNVELFAVNDMPAKLIEEITIQLSIVIVEVVWYRL